MARPIGMPLHDAMTPEARLALRDLQDAVSNDEMWAAVDALLSAVAEEAFRTSKSPGITEKMLIIQALKQIWNARGEADAKAVAEKLASLTGWVTSEPYRQHLREAIQALDRK
jgi:hypothetical protein